MRIPNSAMIIASHSEFQIKHSQHLSDSQTLPCGTNGTPCVETHYLRNKVSLKFTSIDCAWHQIDFDTTENIQQWLQMLAGESLHNELSLNYMDVHTYNADS